MARIAFRYGVQANAGTRWASDGELRILAADGSHGRAFPLSSGEVVGSCRVFSFTEYRADARYDGWIISGSERFDLFADADLSRLMDPDDPYDELPPAGGDEPRQADAAPARALPEPSRRSYTLDPALLLRALQAQQRA